MFQHIWQEEMDYEVNARDDYWAEIAAEHKEDQSTLDAEQQYYFEQNCIAEQDAMEARQGPLPMLIAPDWPF
jgi:hypothetical protein